MSPRYSYVSRKIMGMAELTPLETIPEKQRRKDDWHFSFEEIAQLFRLLALTHRVLGAVLDHQPLSGLLPKLIMDLDAFFFDVTLGEEQVPWKDRAAKYEDWAEQLEDREYYPYVYRTQYSHGVVLTHEPAEAQPES